MVSAGEVFDKHSHEAYCFLRTYNKREDGMTAQDVENVAMIAIILGMLVVLYRLEKKDRQCPKCATEWSVKRRKSNGPFQEHRVCTSPGCDFEEEVPGEGTLFAPKKKD